MSGDATTQRPCTGRTGSGRALISLTLTLTLAAATLVVSSATSPAARAAPASDSAPPPPAIALMGLRAASPDEQKHATLMTQALAEALHGVYQGRVITAEDVKSMLDAKAQQQLLGCEDVKCAMDVSNALAADVIIIGTTGSSGGAHHAFLTLFDGKSGRVVGRASYTWTPPGPPVPSSSGGVALALGDVKAPMKQLALRALSPDAKESGDQMLPDLRTAVAVDEVDEKGAPLPLGRVGACIQGQLVNAGVPVVSADQVARIKAQLAPPGAAAGAAASALSGEALDALDAAAVDVILRGTARFAEAGRYHTNVAMRGTLSFEVINVDTGEIIASTSTSAMQRAPSVDGAVGLAAEALCSSVKPELQAALVRRVERGMRIVLDSQAAKTPAAAQTLGRELEKMKPLIARTKLVKVDDKGAILDVVLRGGDAIALALAFEKAGQGTRVVKASPAALSLKE